jgi:ankyrin repeat protein
VIKPRPDTKDYYGNLPIYYSLMRDDVDMIENYFKKGREHFPLRNYKFETVFHICAKYNSLASLKQLIGKSVFIEELLKKDFKGDTPIHTAAKSGSIDVLEFYITACTRNFLEIQNDFGFTPKDAVT